MIKYLLSFCLLAQIATAKETCITLFNEIFGSSPPKTLLEFGPASSTKDFLDSCESVVSVEFVTHGYGPETIKALMEDYSSYANWTPIVFFSGYRGPMHWAPHHFPGTGWLYHAACHQGATGQSYAPINDYYLCEINGMILGIVEEHAPEAAFINTHGMYMRGEIVNLLFDKVAVILAQDTSDKKTYLYNLVKKPENYEEIYFPEGTGTTIWIKKERAELIEKSRKIADEMK